MDPFSSPSPSGSGLGVSNEVMMGQVKQQLAQAYAEEFFGRVGKILCKLGERKIAILVNEWVKVFEFKHGVNGKKTVRDKCFSKCVTKPSSSLSGGESSCISRCVERYIEATGIVSRAVITALPR